MSALGSLIGVGCSECKRIGHHCQAQMWQECEGPDGDARQDSPRPVCLPCADGEPCSYERARASLSKTEPEEADPCIVPKLTEADRAAVRAMGKPKSVYADNGRGIMQFSPELREAIMEDLETMTAQEVADRYFTSKGRIENLRYNERRRAAAYAQKTARELVTREIGGETVRIAPLASMGSEMLLEIPQGHAACTLCGEFFGAKELRRHLRLSHGDEWRRLFLASLDSSSVHG